MEEQYFDVLSDEIIFRIALDMLPNQINTYCQISGRFNTVVCNDKYFWKQKLLRDFGVKSTSNNPRVEYIKMFDKENVDTSVGLATQVGRLDVLQYIYDVARRNRVIINWYNGMRAAIQTCNIDLVKFLMSKGAEIPHNGLRLATEVNCRELIYFFISEGENDWDGAMTSAVLVCNMELMEYFISMGANDWDRGLHAAASLNDKTCAMELSEYFILRGANNLNQAMASASTQCNKELVEYLVSLGANSWDWGLQQSIWNNSTELIEYFIERGAKDWNIPLLISVQSENVELVHLFIQKGATNLRSSLSEASIKGSIQIMQILIEAMRGNENFNLWMNQVLAETVVYGGDSCGETIKYLLKNGADYREALKLLGKFQYARTLLLQIVREMGLE